MAMSDCTSCLRWFHVPTRRMSTSETMIVAPIALDKPTLARAYASALFASGLASCPLRNETPDWIKKEREQVAPASLTVFSGLMGVCLEFDRGLLKV